MPFDYSAAQLIAYLDEAAPAGQMSEIEVALREDSALRERLAEIVSGRDAGLHSLGEIWRNQRLTCPTREQLGSHLLGVLPDGPDGGLAGYVKFHLDQVECRWCLANLEDLQQKHSQTEGKNAADGPAAAETRRGRYFQSSVGRLSGR
ncbi:hypothetical protein [Botrimarina hoheduenensis]|uniref:Uncharacterized protein n=1 Tax=Botrimarina hoheduenensis TaxID=2528000 RepID=A0A5C5W913_9BACT|nr:hypothetical protein [Botrimarina hoheduenensis]TWT46763.1 hypothetical protein Pla111_18640 [Botrimarina hoheduenensis]